MPTGITPAGTPMPAAMSASGQLIVDTSESFDTLTVGGMTGIPVSNLVSQGLQEQMLVMLRKIEYHLAIATDTELKDQDV